MGNLQRKTATFAPNTREEPVATEVAAKQLYQDAVPPWGLYVVHRFAKNTKEYVMDIQKLAEKITDPHEFPNIGHDETRWLAEDYLEKIEKLEQIAALPEDSTKAVQLAREMIPDKIDAREDGYGLVAEQEDDHYKLEEIQSHGRLSTRR